MSFSETDDDDYDYDADLDEEKYSSEPINIDPEIFRSPSKLIAFMSTIDPDLGRITF